MSELAPDRVEVLKRIEEYERLGYFDRDVENDPPTRPLRPGEVDYTLRKFSSRIASEIANEVARRHFDKCIKRGELVIREVRGMEHYLAVQHRGVMITSNHFHPFDNYSVFKTGFFCRENYHMVFNGNGNITKLRAFLAAKHIVERYHNSAISAAVPADDGIVGCHIRNRNLTVGLGFKVIDPNDGIAQIA